MGDNFTKCEKQVFIDKETLNCWNAPVKSLYKLYILTGTTMNSEQCWAHQECSLISLVQMTSDLRFYSNSSTQTNSTQSADLRNAVLMGDHTNNVI